jgi:RNA polymerase sigma-70 factor (ECF subfamily)
MDEKERSLVEMVLSGRAEAFEPLVRPYRDAIMGLAFRLTRNREDAQEVAQDALLRAYKYLKRFDTSRSFRNWLFRIAVNEARDRARRAHRERSLIEAAEKEIPRHPSREPHPETGEFRSALMGHLSALTAREREVFVLRDIEGLDVKETARALGASGISVRVNLSSARRKLRDALRNTSPKKEVRS